VEAVLAPGEFDQMNPAHRSGVQGDTEAKHAISRIDNERGMWTTLGGAGDRRHDGRRHQPRHGECRCEGK
jgi:hypothetical protein